MSSKYTDMQERMKARLRESRLLTPSGRVGEFTQPSRCLFLHVCNITFTATHQGLSCAYLFEISNVPRHFPLLRYLPFQLRSMSPFRVLLLDNGEVDVLDMRWLTSDRSINLMQLGTVEIAF